MYFFREKKYHVFAEISFLIKQQLYIGAEYLGVAAEKSSSAEYKGTGGGAGVNGLTREVDRVTGADGGYTSYTVTVL